MQREKKEKQSVKMMQNSVPVCVGIIMDGNRRWARERNLPTLAGHKKGYQKLKEIAGWCKKIGIRNLIVYAFSTENWGRKKEEVNYLMDLFREFIFKESEWLKKEDLRIKFVGQTEQFDADIRAGIENIERETKKGTNILYVAISYGGRAEILQAVKKIAREVLPEKIKSMQENDFAEYLWTQNMPDPDIIIRLGGEKRLSNFLSWQSVYSELFFPETYWPAFTEKEFLDIIEEYGNRKRRKGK